MRVEEINNKLKTGDIVPPERQRSPSPPPTYDAHGRRTNTREVRYRRKLEDERVRLVDKALKLDPAYRPPTEYHAQKRNTKPTDKVYIPVKEFPEINFFGLILGPRGNTQKGMEKESGARISIRGKGSVKEGKGRPENTSHDAEEDLHCLVTADDPEKVRICVNLINSVIAVVSLVLLPRVSSRFTRSDLRPLSLRPVAGRLHTRSSERAQDQTAPRACRSQRNASRRRKPGLPQLWKQGTQGASRSPSSPSFLLDPPPRSKLTSLFVFTEMGLPRAAELLRRNHLCVSSRLSFPRFFGLCR